MATESQKVPSNLDVGEYPLLKRIREKGLRRALVESIDEAIERTTVGLNLSDARALLQDRALSKPNVRLKPHADGALHFLCSPHLRHFLALLTIFYCENLQTVLEVWLHA